MFSGSLAQTQADGINALPTTAADLRTVQQDYVLATAYHETAATIQPIAEYGYGKGRRFIRSDEQPSPADAFGGGLLVDPIPLRKNPHARLTILYCSTDRLRRRGAPMQNLSRSESLQTCERIAPSNAGIKQLIIREGK